METFDRAVDVLNLNPAFGNLTVDLRAVEVSARKVLTLSLQGRFPIHGRQWIEIVFCVPNP